MLKYVFMGSPALAATVLDHLCTHLYPPEAVVTQTAKAAGRGQKVLPTAVEDFARRQGLTCFTTLDVNHPSTFEPLRTFAPDLILVAAFGQILKAPVLALPKLFPLNLHASLLPKYRGASPVQRAIWNGDAETGVTVQKMAKKLDTGDILLTKKIPILPEETSGELMQRLADLGGIAFVEAVKLVDSERFTFTPQDDTAATYAPKIDKADAVLDWNLPAERLRNQIRALQPWPVAETRVGKDRCKIFRAEVVAGAGTPGSVATNHKDSLVVTCGNGTALSLTEIQLENRKRLGIRDFMMAYRGNFPFSRLGDPSP